MQIGLANGCFDLFHKGHYHFLTRCRARCDYLIVAVNSDASVKRLKGEGRPHQNVADRMMRLHKYADAVIPFEGREDKLIMEIRPDVLFKGYDHSPADFLAMRKPGWKEHGLWDRVKVIQISHLPGFSTTRILDASESNA